MRNKRYDKLEQITIPRLDDAVTVLSPDGEELKTVFLMDSLAKPEYRRLLDHISWFNNHDRSEEHTSELQSLMRISYAVSCLQKKINLHKYTSVSVAHTI